MSTLSLTTSQDFSLSNLSNVTLIDFANVVIFRFRITATFDAAQFDNVHISSHVQIDGQAGLQGVIVNGSSLDASGWTFTNWQATDLVYINGTASADHLVGSASGDVIAGFAGNDAITGGEGLDNLSGGSGNDTFHYNAAGDLVTGETIAGGDGSFDTIQIDGAGNFNFMTVAVSGIERLKFAADAIVDLGSASMGAAGIATVIGDQHLNVIAVKGQSVDLANVTFSGWADGTDVVFIQGDPFIGSTLAGTGFGDTFYGGTGADVMTGRAGNDTFTGLSGADTLQGGQGDDTFTYNKGAEMDPGETVSGGAGTDTIGTVTLDTYDLTTLTISSVEQLKIDTDGGVFSLRGSQIGGAGHIDTVIGSAGTSQIVVLGSTDLSGVTFQNWKVSDGITIVGDDLANNVIVGSSHSDIIVGGSLDDRISGGGSPDNLNGGGGIDTLSYAGSAAGVAVNLQTNTAANGDAAGDIIFGFENLTGGSGGDTLTGDAGSNVISGGGGNDVLVGGNGADTLLGGAGDDIIRYNNVSEVVTGEVVDGGAGTDMIELNDPGSGGWVFFDTTVSGIEQVKFDVGGVAAFNDASVGAAAGLINSVIGSAGQNVLGIAGTSIDLTGVTFSGWSAINDLTLLQGTSGDDTIYGSSVNDSLNGGAGADTLSGGAGSDRLFGDIGKDVLSGGANADTFVYSDIAESAVGAGRDRITDFTQGSDRIDLSAIDANGALLGDAFNFIGKVAFSNAAGELRAFQNVQSGITVVEGDTNGDGTPDFQIQLTGLYTLSSADFVL